MEDCRGASEWEMDPWGDNLRHTMPITWYYSRERGGRMKEKRIRKEICTLIAIVIALIGLFVAGYFVPNIHTVLAGALGFIFILMACSAFFEIREEQGDNDRI